jgi:hypothetical protein
MANEIAWRNVACDREFQHPPKNLFVCGFFNENVLHFLSQSQDVSYGRLKLEVIVPDGIMTKY